VNVSRRGSGRRPPSVDCGAHRTGRARLLNSAGESSAVRYVFRGVGRSECVPLPENLFLVLTNPIEVERGLQQWYDTQQVAEVLDVPGVIAHSGTTCVRSQFRRMKISRRNCRRPHTVYTVLYELDPRTRPGDGEFSSACIAGHLFAGETLDLSTISLYRVDPRAIVACGRLVGTCLAVMHAQRPHFRRRGH